MIGAAPGTYDKPRFQGWRVDFLLMFESSLVAREAACSFRLTHNLLYTTVHGFVVMVKGQRGERAQQFAFLHGNCVVQERAICAKSL